MSQDAPEIFSADAAVPFDTATVGSIYLDQGKLNQAEQIFRRVLERHPEDRRCQAGLAEIERRREADGAAVVDTVEAEVSPRGGGGTIVCRFKVSDRGLARARMVTGEDGRLTLRLLGFPADQDPTPVDTPLETESGAVEVSSPGGATLAAVAVGLLTVSGAFVSIAHSKIIQLTG